MVKERGLGEVDGIERGTQKKETQKKKKEAYRLNKG